MGALTLANAALAKEAAASLDLPVEFLIVSMRDRGPDYASDLPAYDLDSRRLLLPGGSWRTLGAQDCVLDIGAGDSFAEIYGFKRFAYLWTTKMQAILQKVPLMLAPQTIGPFTRSPYTQLARLALERAAVVMARDQASLDAVRRLAPRANGALSVDVAFALPFDDQSQRRGGRRPRIGVNVSGLLFREAETGRNSFGLQVDYAELMRRFIGDLVARGDVEVVLFTHANSNTGQGDDDANVADRLAAEFPSAIRQPDFPGPCEAKSFISGLDFVVAGRMHACIAALSSGAPVVPVAYSRKFSGLFGTLGYPWMVPVNGMGDQEALAYLNDCLDRRDALQADAQKSRAAAAQLLDRYRKELRDFFAGVAASR